MPRLTLGTACRVREQYQWNEISHRRPEAPRFVVYACLGPLRVLLFGNEEPNSFWMGLVLGGAANYAGSRVRRPDLPVRGIESPLYFCSLSVYCVCTQ